LTEPTRTGATPFLYFADVAAAIDWLAAAFGCVERFRLTGPAGFVLHAEVEIGGAVEANARRHYNRLIGE
jgi:PhnB protein